MTSGTRTPVGIALAVLLALAACSGQDTPVPSTSPAPATSLPDTTAPGTTEPGPVEPAGWFDPDAPALAFCDDFDVACERPVAVLGVPVAGADLALVWASDFPLVTELPGGQAWSFDVLHSYDARTGVLALGHGGRRVVAATAIDDRLAVPSVDGELVYEFDRNGRHLRTVDVLTGVTVQQFTWSDGELESIVGPAGTTTVVRDDEGIVTGLTTGRGYETLLDHTAGALTAIADPAGNITWIAYDEHGRVVRLTEPTMAETTVAYHDDGSLARITEPNGDAWLYAVETLPEGYLLRRTTPGGTSRDQHVTLSEDTMRRVLTDERGAVTTVTIDGAQRTIEHPDGTTEQLALHDDPRWGAAAPLVAGVRTAADGVTTTFTEERRYPTEEPSIDELLIAAGDGVEFRWTVDDERRVWHRGGEGITVVDAAGRAEQVHYDEAGHLVEWSGPNGDGSLEWEDGLLRAIVFTTGGETRTWRLEQEPDADTITVTDPIGQVSELQLDARGEIIAVSDAAGRRTVIARDQLGRIVTFGSDGRLPLLNLHRPDGRIEATSTGGGDAAARLATYSYDPDGRLRARQLLGGETIEVVRGHDGLPVEVRAGDDSWSLAHDASGRLTSVSAGGVVLERAWHPTGVLASESWGGDVDAVVSHAVDGRGRRVAVEVNGTSVPYRYDAAGLLTGAGEMEIAYDATGRVATETLGALTRSYAWNGFGELLSTTITIGDEVVYELQLERDGIGRVTSLAEAVGGVGTAWQFGYDASGLLAEQTGPGGTTRFSYDGTGVLFAEDGPGGEVAYRYDSAGALIARAATDGTVDYAYDASGQLAAAGDASFVYDALGGLRAATTPEGVAVEYVVDGRGRRIARTVDGETAGVYAYLDDLRPVAELDGDGEVAALYVFGAATTTPAYLVRDGATLLVVSDHLGTPRALIDAATGELVDAIDVDGWGVPTGSLDALPYGFAGGIVDPLTGLVRFGARDYDPLTRRWTAPDPAREHSGDPDLYRYAYGDPVNLVDRGGMTPASVTPCVGATCVGSDGRVMPGSPTNIAKITITGGSSSSAGSGSRSPEQQLLDEMLGKPSASYCPVPGACVGASVGPGGITPTGCVGDCKGGASAGPPTSHWDFIARMHRWAAKQFYTAADLLDGTSKPSGDPRPAGGGGRRGSVKGDPHLWTLGGTHVNFQAAGEFVLLADDTVGMTVQTRFERAPYGIPASYVTAVAMDVSGERVTIQPAGDGVTIARVDGAPVSNALTTELAGGGTLAELGDRWIVTWPDGSTVSASSTFNSQMWVEIDLADARLGETLDGLIGATGDGVVYTAGGDELAATELDDYDTLHRSFGDSWRVAEADSLFDYAPGESVATFDDREFPGPPAAAPDATQLEIARATCAALGIDDQAVEACAFDLSTTGEPALAIEWARQQRFEPATIALPPAVAPSMTAPERIAVDGGTIATGETISGSIDTADHQVGYEFEAAAGEVVYLAADPDCDPGVDLLWVVRAPDSSWINSATICVDLGRVPVVNTGTLTITVESYDGDTGPYAFEIIASGRDHHGAIEVGERVSGTIAEPGLLHHYEFDATAGEVVYLAADADCDRSVDLLWVVRDPDGTRINSATTCTDLGRLLVESTGTHTITIESYLGSTGPYAFEIVPAGHDDDTTIEVGDVVGAAIDQPGLQHRYAFDATAGEVVYLAGDPDCDRSVDLLWEVRDPDGTRLDSATTCTDIGRVLPETAGTYTITVSSYLGGTGPYTFEVIAAGHDHHGTIGVGDTVTGTLDDPGLRHEYSFDAAAGQTVAVHWPPDCRDEPSDLLWELRGPDDSTQQWNLICNDLDAFDLPTAGEWTIRIYGYHRATGDYTFILR